MSDYHKVLIIRTLLTGAIIVSILMTFYVMVIKSDYDVLTNPEGPDTSDYFEE